MSTLTNITREVAAIIGLCATGVARVMGARMCAGLTGGPTGAEDLPDKQLPT